MELLDLFFLTIGLAIEIKINPCAFNIVLKSASSSIVSPQ
jgi:hypothetical protein